MTKNELLAAIKDGQEKLNRSIQDLDEESLLEPGVSGEWSIKDILAHITRWEAEQVAMLFQIQRGLIPKTAHFGKLTTDELNEKWYKESLARSLAQVHSDLQGVHRQILRRVEEFSEQDLGDPKRYPFLEGKSLAEYVASDTYEHDLNHVKDIRDWEHRKGLKTNS